MKRSFFLIIGIIALYSYNVFAGKGHDLIKYARKGDLAKVQQIIAAGVDLNATDKNKLTALTWAAHTGYIEIVKLLIDKGANVNAQGSWTALSWAAASGHTGIVILLLENGAYINAVNEHGCTALMLAAYSGEPETVRILIDKGANLTMKSKYSITALMMAKQKFGTKQDQHNQIANMLIDAGAKE